MRVKGKNIEISNPDKILFPENGFTKEDVINYYLDIADYILPYVKGRPLMMQRFPDGIDHPGFYHKEAPEYFPDWIRKEKLERKEGGKITQVICDNPETLVYLSNQATITLHTWLSLVENPGHPDKIIIDLDPPTRNFESIRDSLPGLKEYLEKKDIKGFLMSTGSKGMHIVIPVKPKQTFELIKKKMEQLADEIVREFGDKFTTAQLKEKREDKIYLDIQRNSYAQTGVAPFSLRPLEGAPVATPVSWKNAKQKEFHSRLYHLKNIFRRLGQVQNPWEHFFDPDLAKKNQDRIFHL
jgi:bifunctional non-homologous end joining protein LigD